MTELSSATARVESEAYQREILALRVEIEKSTDARVQRDGTFLLQIANQYLSTLGSSQP